MFARINSMGIYGIESYMVGVEVDFGNGLPRIDMVGLPDAAVSEARNRVRSAIKNTGFKFPQSRLTINFTPADVKKEGSFYDLPIFIAVLKANQQIKCYTDDCAFIGELSLDGLIRGINGVLPMVIRAKNSGIKRVFVPKDNALESSVVKGIEVYAAESVVDVVKHLNGEEWLTPLRYNDVIAENDNASLPDFKDVKGQDDAKYALEIAAAGGHNILMIGPPGSGKSMLAKRLPSILPDMTFEESLQTTEIYSIAGALPQDVSLITRRPFRDPHHTVTTAGLVGGGVIPRPGEMSLAHNGVLFLDELPEFSRSTMEVLRQPIEDGKVTISRANATLTYPCSTMIVCAMNPCPCGYFGNPRRQCTCTGLGVKRYLAKISGPLLDRIDIHIEVPPVEYENLTDSSESESSAEIKKRVDAARKIQQKRFEGSGVTCNAKMDAAMTREFCRLTPEAESFMRTIFDKLDFSARAYDKILRLSRTIADLENSDMIKNSHVAQAAQYRTLDRDYWKR